MDHKKILTRTWRLIWNSKALWLFGFLFALAGGSGGFRGGGGSNGGGGQSQNNGGSGGWPGTFPDFQFRPPDWNTIVLIAVIAILVVLLLTLLTLIVRYVAETALLAGVDEIEASGEKLTVRRGFRLGWSRQALRLFLVDLAVYLPLTLGALLLIAAAALPLLVWLTQIVPLGVIATIFSVGLEMLIILILVVLALALSVVMPFVRRRVVLGGQGVRAAVREGFALVRASLKDTGLMWLLLAALRILWSLVFIPIFLLLVVVSVMIGGVPALLAYLASQSWVAAAIVGGILFLVAIIPSTAFFEGLFETYTSAAWTLTYREASGRYPDLLAARPS